MSSSFVPIDLSDRFNAGLGNPEIGNRWLWPASDEDSEYKPLQRLPAGNVEFWGIPFLLADVNAGKRFSVVCQEGGTVVPATVSLPIGEQARRLLFAHVCAPTANDSPTIEGAGEPIGEYRILFDDGSTSVQPLRRRFEVHDVEVPWGHHPFRCRNCQIFRSVPLDDRNMVWGRVQTGVYSGDLVNQASDQDGWWILDWENPFPEKLIKEIEMVSTGRAALALGGITICSEAADPLRWAPREEVAVSVEGDDEAPQVEMERGVVARQDDLLVPEENFLETDETGWGLGGQRVERGGYIEVHGSPEGILQIKAEETQCFRWGDLLESGSQEQGRARVELVSPHGKQWVHVRVEDEATGNPVGSRVHFRSPQGAYFAPHGHQADVNDAWFEDIGGDCRTRGTPYAYIDGVCQIELPIGTVFAEVVRGFEYEPIRCKFEIKPGQRELTLEIRRAFDMKERRYYSGDTHVHFLSSQSSHLEAAGEDLNVVNLLASQWGRLFTSWEEFTGGLSPTSSDDHLIWVSQENRQHVLGHISLLGLKEMVAPMCTGGPNEDWIGGEVQTLMADWAKACHLQGGSVIMPHMPVPDFENAANIVLGHADAAEMCWVWLGEKIGQGERGYYRWLNVGQKLPIVGGTDKMSNGRILGGSRTYAKLADDEEFTYENWCRAVRRGNTFASTGAMIDLTVDGCCMGEELCLPGNGGQVEVEAVAESVWPLSGIELIVNGESVAQERSAGERRISINYKLCTEASCWVAARCWGPYLTDAGPVMAHSSPVYVDVGKRRAFVESDSNYLLTHMEGGVAWAQEIGVFKDERVRDKLIGLFREAQRELHRRG